WGDVARRVGAASQTESCFINMTHGCVPITTAFTHGYSDVEFKNGLNSSPSVKEVKQGAKFVAEKHGQEVIPYKINQFDREVLTEQLKRALKTSDSCWVVHFTDKGEKLLNGHMMGIIPIASNEYARWNTAVSNRIARLNINQLVDEVIRARHNKIPDVYLFAFKSI
ncbi:hypothetical protein KKG65_00535, partial [Patescibacteria group bacterium]|nr:hypothetical protein [Patescibacteria group bacterium]